MVPKMRRLVMGRRLKVRILIFLLFSGGKKRLKIEFRSWRSDCIARKLELY